MTKRFERGMKRQSFSKCMLCQGKRRF